MKVVSDTLTESIFKENTTLERCNGGFMPKISLPSSNQDVAVYGGILDFMRPRGRLSIMETCEGNIQVSYFDLDGKGQQSYYSSTKELDKTELFQKWISNDRNLRNSVGLNEDLSIKLNEPISLNEDWTVEAWICSAIDETSPIQWPKSTAVKGAIKITTQLPQSNKTIELNPNNVIKIPCYSLKSFTVMAWIRPDKDIEENPVIGQLGKGEKSKLLHLVIRNNKAYFGAYACDTEGSKQINPNIWTHVTWTYDNKKNEQAIYVNGELDIRCENKEFYGISESSILSLGSWGGHVGANIYNGYGFNGMISDLRIWDTALSEDDIKKNKENGPDLDNKHLIHYYPMHDAVETSMYTAVKLYNYYFWGDCDKIKSWGEWIDPSIMGSDQDVLYWQKRKEFVKNFLENKETIQIPNHSKYNLGKQWDKKFNSDIFYPSRPIYWNLDSEPVYEEKVSLISKIERILPKEFSENIFTSFDNCAIAVKKSRLGIIAEKKFYECGFDISDLKNGWHHIAAVGRTLSDKSITTFFVDGIKVGISSEKNNLKITHITNHSASNTEDKIFKKISEIRIWETALSDNEIEFNSRTLLNGNEPGLIAYYTKVTIEKNLDNYIETKNPAYLDSGNWEVERWTLPNTDLIATSNSSELIGIEYVSFGINPETRETNAMMKRLLAWPENGGLQMLCDKRIEELELKWIGNLQLAPTLLGFIEGAPPIPSENLTEEADYNGATSVELALSEDMTLSWNRNEGRGIGFDISGFLGIDSKSFASPGVGIMSLIEANRFGGTFRMSGSLSQQAQTNISSVDKLAKSNKLCLTGSPEKNARFVELGRRFVPRNIGYALVVSSLADVYITRLSRSKRMISYSVMPVADVDPDINTITFLINPAYTMNGSLDGMTGTNPTSDRFFRHVPDMRAQYGSLYPASYYRIGEAYELKRQIQDKDKERMAYFENFSTWKVLLGDESSFHNKNQDDNASNNLRDSEGRKAQLEEKENEIRSRFSSKDEQFHAATCFYAWQKRMEDILIKAGKRNIVNTYVWDADGGMHVESQEFASAIEHSMGNYSTWEASIGAEVDFNVLVPFHRKLTRFSKSFTVLSL